ncbi:TatD family hydrolase [soil metagenome]
MSESANLEFIDTHAHLNDPQFSTDREEVLADANRSGVSTVVNVAFSESLWASAIALNDRHRSVPYTLGIHPNNAEEWSQDAGARLVELARSSLPVAIGETGLDYYWDRVPKTTQMASFDAQLSIAAQLDLPVIIHLRGDVEADLRQTIGGHPRVRCVFHSFDGSPELFAWIIERGWVVGVGGLISRRSAKSLREMLRTAPLEHIVLETDSPYLAPTGWSEKRNAPSAIPIIADHLARLRGDSLETVSSGTTSTARKAFALDQIAPVLRTAAESSAEQTS